MKYLYTLIFFLYVCSAIICLPSVAYGDSLPKKGATIHAGFFYPNGIDLIGYTAENTIKTDIYYYYTFGFPSIAATGISYYSNYISNSVVISIGVGIGSIGYSSLEYQLRVADKQYIKLGVGYTTGIAYTGMYPVLSYEYRFLSEHVKHVKHSAYFSPNHISDGDDK